MQIDKRALISLRKLPLGVAVLLLSTGLAVAPSAHAADLPQSMPGQGVDAPSVPDQLLIGFDPGASASQRAAARNQEGARLFETVAAGGGRMARVELVALPPGADDGAAARRFASNPNVRFAEPNFIYSTGATSNDPSYTDGSLWGMYGDATSPTNQFGSQAGEAWGAGNTGSGSVYIGVIDEGVQQDHPDLRANVWTNQFETMDNLDNDGNGYVDDVNGWDFDGGNNTTYDGTADNHGTHVAGTVGATGANGVGVAGVAWDVRLITAKFLGANGGTTANAVKAVDYLTDLKTRHGLNIVASNNSWGGGGFSQALLDAITRADVANILFIAAAGNGGSDGVGDNNDSVTSYPSGYNSPNVVAVAAIDKAGAKAAFSNYGATTVDLGAPGVGVVSTVPGGGYASYNGTSMATPHVTGAAVLYAAANPGKTAADTKAAILASVVPTASMANRTVTGGRLDVSGFVAPAQPAPNQPPAAAFTSSCSGLTCAFTDTSTDDVAVTAWAWAFGDSTSSTAQSPSHTFASAGTYPVVLEVRDASGLSSTTTRSVTVAVAAPAPTISYATSSFSSGNGWKARVTMTVSGSGGTSSQLTGSWAGTSGTTSCTATGDTSCTITSNQIRKSTTSVAFNRTAPAPAATLTILKPS